MLQVCGKGFCHRQSLITHSTLHTGIKPYQCDNCGNSFSCIGNLLKHRKSHLDTCGSIPLTTHRVNNPSTRIKIKVNTPATSKLKVLKKDKEIEEKLRELEEISVSQSKSLIDTSGKLFILTQWCNYKFAMLKNIPHLFSFLKQKNYINDRDTQINKHFFSISCIRKIKYSVFNSSAFYIALTIYLL